MVKVLSFDEALEKSQETTRNLLLGNGFSLAYDKELFHYDSLYDRAKSKIESVPPSLSSLFDEYGCDFEIIIKMLQQASKVVELYKDSGGELSRSISSRAEIIKAVLIETIIEQNPETVNLVIKEKLLACIDFLSHFLKSWSKDGDDKNYRNRKAGNVFTFNYDLMLYWTLMQAHYDGNVNDAADNLIFLDTNDGFGRDPSGSEKILWLLGGNSQGEQRVFYLHGALHLYSHGHEVEKLKWSSKNGALLEQAKERINNNSFPVFVAEGNSPAKLKKIKSNEYLDSSYNKFIACVKKEEHSLFVHGHSFSENDDHVIERIAFGCLPYLYISIYGDPESDDNKRIIAKANSLAETRTRERREFGAPRPLKVRFYDAESAKVWG